MKKERLKIKRLSALKNQWLGIVSARAGMFPVYLLCAAAGAVVYTFLAVNTEWTLYPYTKALNSLFGYHFYFTGAAYEAAGSNLVISKTCSGLNTFLSIYTILIFGFLHRFTGLKNRLFGVLVSFTAAIFIAYCATLLRIIISLPFCDSQHFYLIHNAVTLCIFYGAGFSVYLTAQKIIWRIQNGFRHKTV